MLLPNGNVLAAGGQDGKGNGFASAELYSASLGNWSTTGDLATARFSFQMVLLPNGNVLAAGGTPRAGAVGATAELYSPSTGRWTATGPLATGRYLFQTVLLPNGNVLAAGGVSLTASNNGVEASAEVYR